MFRFLCGGLRQLFRKIGEGITRDEPLLTFDMRTGNRRLELSQNLRDILNARLSIKTYFTVPAEYSDPGGEPLSLIFRTELYRE